MIRLIEEQAGRDRGRWRRRQRERQAWQNGCSMVVRVERAALRSDAGSARVERG